MNVKKILPLIPARGGSKGVKNKNIHEVNNKPLIQYTIETAISTNIFDHIFVSTDSEKIAEVSLKLGAKVPFIRPESLAQDESNSIDVMKHALEWFNENKGLQFEYLLLLQPTSPLRNENDIINSIELIP